MSEIFHIFGIEWKLLLVNIFNFAVLTIALSYLLYKPTIKHLDERRKKIEEGILNAEKAEKKLSEAKEQEKQIISQAKKESEQIIESAKDSAKKEASEILQDAKAQALSTIAMAKREAQEAKKEIEQEAKEELAKEAVLLAKRIMQEAK